MFVFIIGACGCGKTTVGSRLADRLQWPYFEADDFHSADNKAKMASGRCLLYKLAQMLKASGQPLTDADRWPWLDAIAGVFFPYLFPQSLL